MRILLVSDIHANPAALTALREPFDYCLFLGDLVDYGVEPGQCIEWIRKNVYRGVRGNHDHGVAQCVYLQGAVGFRYLTGVTRNLSIDRTTEEQRTFLGRMPTTSSFTLGDKRFFLVHASPKDPLDEYAPADLEFWRRRLDGIDADYVCVGHTHMQYTLQVGKTTVINPGSLGLPRDGDPRAAFAMITDEGIQLHRVEYPVEEAVAAVRAAPLPDLAKQLMIEVYRTGKLEKKPSNGFHEQRSTPRAAQVAHSR
jgi:putative phosphoesterase